VITEDVVNGFESVFTAEPGDERESA